MAMMQLLVLLFRESLSVGVFYLLWLNVILMKKKTDEEVNKLFSECSPVHYWGISVKFNSNILYYC